MMRDEWFDINWLSERLVQLQAWRKALLIGVLLGLIGGVIGLAVTLVNPLYVLVGVLGLLVGLYILTDLQVALFAVLAVVLLFPFGTLPIKIAITPTVLDLTLGAFLLVYLFQWMTGRRRLLRTTPIHGLVLLFAVFLMFSFVLGLGHSPLRTDVMRQFAELLMSIAAALVLVDALRDEATLRRVVLVVVLVAGLTAVIGIGLYVLPDATAEAVLVRLGRFGYPDGGVIRYVEENPALAERAIGMWVDPNAFGGVLAVLGALVAPQVFAARPLGGTEWWRRGLVIGVFGAVGLSLYLTYSRGALMALAAALVFIAVLRYRRLLWLMILGGVGFLILPVTQAYVARFLSGFQGEGADLATQMRFGEITDSLRLIGRYPVFGVGFSGTPERDIYLGVANLYLTMASNIGLVGLAIFLILIAALLLYGLRAWRRPSRSDSLEAIWLGTHAGIVAALGAGVFDHYFFKLEFQASVTLFWLVIGLALTTSTLWLHAPPES
ncbi:MAG: O-antigen ligase family protein [Anaerolineae bacterium]|nr:O-antigen ligase family protein [Anaerolineae bacterium]